MKKPKNSMNLFILPESVFLLLAGGYLMYLRFVGALRYYIRPDYDSFTLIMGIILMCAGICNLALFITTPQPYTATWKCSPRDIGKLLMISLVVILGICIPKKSLSSQTALRRGTNQNTIIGQQALKGISADVNSLKTSPLTGKSISNHYTISDWVGLFQIDPEPDSYEGKAVDVVGFVQPIKDGTFAVTRFVVSCCIVDASPIGLPVDRNLESLKADDWIEVHGTFGIKTVGGNRQIVIKPDVIEKVMQPVEPYLY